jgi:chromosome segregation ATPase
VHDSNAARSAIANNYMKMCTGLWIVAPITRAVDDKAAKSLLGESFKRQLKYDGTYSRVTFICSKTDDISITEASDSLGLEEEMSSKWETFDKIERDQKRVKKEMAELKESKAIFGEVLSDTDDQLEVWDKLRDDLEDGKTVYAPTLASKKRKKSNKSPKQRKKRTSERNSDDDDFIDDDDDDASSLGSQNDTASQGEPLTSEIIEAKIAELKSTKKEARLQRRELDSQILNLREELKGLDSAHEQIEAEMSKICISGRNQYSKGAIQQDVSFGQWFLGIY